MRTATIASAVALILTTTAATAAVTPYVSNPTSNREDWIAAVGPMVTNIDFDNPAVGASLSYSSGGVAFGAGPGQGNTFSGPLSSGEGLHPDSNYLYLRSPGRGTSQTVIETFTAPVSAVGVSVIDYFGPPFGDNFLDIAVYSGPGGTGTLLGSATGVRNNFQMNNVYFMGFTSTAANIGSFVFSRAGDSSGDDFGLDDFVSSGGSVANVPEPASWALMIGGFGLVGMAQRRRTAALAA